MSESKKRLSILRIMLAIRETSAPYNQFSLPLADKHQITLCTYFPSDIVPPKTITLFEGNGSVKGFFRVLKAALNAKNYDVIHVHSPHLGLLFLIATLSSYRKFLSSTVITVHDSYEDYKLRNRLMFIPVFASFRKVVCCSWASYKSFPVFFKWLAGKRLCVVQNGLDIVRVDRIAANIHQQQRSTNDFTVVAISRLVDVKNPFSALAIFQQSNDPANRLIYIGDGPLRPSLLAKRSETNLENRVTLTGLIPREKVFEYLLSADLFISLSRGEGLPVSVLEAMASRCPVLLSDIPPHREIAEGVDFIPLVNPDDTEGFTREIKKFREMPASERAVVGQKCRRIVEERFSLAAMHAGYEGVYDEVLESQSPSFFESVSVQRE